MKRPYWLILIADVACFSVEDIQLLVFLFSKHPFSMNSYTKYLYAGYVRRRKNPLRIVLSSIRFQDLNGNMGVIKCALQRTSLCAKASNERAYSILAPLPQESSSPSSRLPLWPPPVDIFSERSLIVDVAQKPVVVMYLFQTQQGQIGKRDKKGLLCKIMQCIDGDRRFVLGLCCRNSQFDCTMITSRDVHEVVWKLSSDKAKTREDGVKLLNTWLEGDMSINFCSFLSHNTAKLKLDQIPNGR
ncbi:hypothetical protein YC2023_072583 [Brassica napus]